MKNSYIIFLLALLSLYCCEQNEGNNAVSILGTWFQNSGELDVPKLSYKNQIIFNDDGTYERSLQIVNTNNSKNIIGYVSLTLGEYRVSENSLQRFNIDKYGLDNISPYLDRDQLILEHSTDELPEVGIRFNDERDVLTLDYFTGNQKCPDLAICVEFESFERD